MYNYDMYVEDAGGSTGQPTPVRVKEVETTTVACMHETETILLLIHLVSSLEQVLDLKSVGFEDVVGRLKAYEERIRDDGGDEQRLMLTRVSGGGGRSSSGGAGSSNGAGGQRVMFTRSNGGCESSGDGRNTGGGSGGGFCVSGFSGFTREMKGRWGKDNNRSKVIYQDRLDSGSGSGGSGSSSGSKAQSTNKPNKPKQSNNQPNHKTIGSNQVQGNAELDWDRRHL